MKWWNLRKKIAVLPPLEGYNRWAATYHQESNPIKNLSDEMVERLLPDLNGKSFLDAGCGTGKFCALAEKNNATQILGLDLSPAMIEVARQHCNSAEFMCGDISTDFIQGKNYDVIVCALVLGHLEHLNPALDNLLTALRSGGSLIITDFHPLLTLLHAKRTFKDQRSGQSIEVRHHLHLFQEYFKIFNKHNAAIEVVEEPLFDKTPVVFGFRVRKN